MIATNGRKNTLFGLVYHLIGGCHTADAAYSLLRDQEQDRATALAAAEAAEWRTKAKRLAAERLCNSADEVDRINGHADIVEITAYVPACAAVLAAAKQELADIQRCIEALKPHRKYTHLPDHEAHTAMQQEEWRLEIIHRAENVLLTGGQIPPELFGTMRMHPELLTGILPQLNETKAALLRGDNVRIPIAATKTFLLELPR